MIWQISAVLMIHIGHLKIFGTYFLKKSVKHTKNLPRKINGLLLRIGKFGWEEGSVNRVDLVYLLCQKDQKVLIDTFLNIGHVKDKRWRKEVKTLTMNLLLKEEVISLKFHMNGEQCYQQIKSPLLINSTKRTNNLNTH